MKQSPGLLRPIRVALLLIIALPALVIGLPALAAGTALRRIYRRWLERRWERTWGRRGKRVLLVYSRSPNWQQHIETAWLPRLGARAVVLDWSDRAGWPRPASLEVKAFRHWGGDREFNPLVLLFPRRGRVRTLRFRQAFRDRKHGKPGRLQQAEAELFELVDQLGADAAEA